MAKAADCTQSHLSDRKTDIFDPSLTLAVRETAIVAHRAEELKYEDGHSYYGQAHDEHHHPHRGTVGLFEIKQREEINI